MKINDNLMYTPKPIDTSSICIPNSLLQVMETLAKHNHDIWAKQRIAEGWSYGPFRNDREKKHPDLLPYEKLPESEKQYDRSSASEIIKIILALGYRIETKKGS